MPAPSESGLYSYHTDRIIEGQRLPVAALLFSSRQEIFQRPIKITLVPFEIKTDK